MLKENTKKEKTADMLQMWDNLYNVRYPNGK
jgi:hypothetical protein